MKQVEKWLKIADTSLSAVGIVDSDSKIKEVYKGYVSSFGAMVIQNGLPAALAINMKTDTEEGKQRIKVIEVIAKVLKDSEVSEYQNIDSKTLLEKSCKLANNGDVRPLRTLKQDVIDAGIALKLMMRTYEFKKSKNED